MAYSLRPMRIDDVPQVNEIDREAFPTQVPPPNYYRELQNQLARYVVVVDDDLTAPAPHAPPGWAARLRRWLRLAPPDRGQAPRKNQYIIGFAGVWVFSDESHITNIAVRRKYQRRGIGEMMMVALIELSGDLKASVMTLEVRASNTIAQSLYRKYGFAETGVRRGYYLDNREDGVIMSTESIVSEAYRQRLRQLKKALGEKLGQPGA